MDKGASASRKGDGPRRRGVKRSRVGPRAEHEVDPSSPPKRGRGAPPISSPDPSGGASDVDSSDDEDAAPAAPPVDVEDAKCRFIAAVRQLGMLGLLRKVGAGKDDVIQKLVFDTATW